MTGADWNTGSSGTDAIGGGPGSPLLAKPGPFDPASPGPALHSGATGYPPDSRVLAALGASVARVFRGDQTSTDLAICAFLSGGHVLLEDIPGVGKTLFAKALAASLGGAFGRAQGTPDLLPSDLTGVSVYDEPSRSWEFQPGPLFNHVVLVDELNRATPRTQSALLEAMAERQVTVDGTTHPLPDPFMVIATQNPHSDVGTFALVAGQRDRFSVSLSFGLPGRQAETELLQGTGGHDALRQLTPVGTLDDWNRLRQRVDDVFLHDELARYALDVVDQLRRPAGDSAPLSTRAALAFVRVARAHALLADRTHVAPEDLQAVAEACLAHRLVDLTDGDLPSARRWVNEVLATTVVPPAPRPVG